MEQNIPQQSWPKVKTEIQKTWSTLSANELEKTHGDIEAIADLITKKFGTAHDEAEKKIEDIIKRSGAQSSDFAEKRFQSEGGGTAPGAGARAEEKKSPSSGTREEDIDEQAP